MGHEEVAWSPQGFSLEHAARQVQELLGQLKAGPAFVIGVSMGATIAMKLALSNPSLIHGLILVSPWSPRYERAYQEPC
jgi:pimeloyl-ACP methyl ester carboxylesterase